MKNILFSVIVSAIIATTILLFFGVGEGAAVTIGVIIYAYLLGVAEMIIPGFVFTLICKLLLKKISKYYPITVKSSLKAYLILFTIATVVVFFILSAYDLLIMDEKHLFFHYVKEYGIFLIFGLTQGVVFYIFENRSNVN